MRSAADLSLPLDAYIETEQQVAAVSRAEDLLVQSCMRRFGFRWTLVEPVPPPFGGNNRRYGVIDEAEAAQYGYHLPDSERERRRRAEEARRARGDLTAAAFAVWSGKGQRAYDGQEIPQGGCIGEARRQLNDQVDNRVLELPFQLADEAKERSEADSRVRRAFEQWSACMRRAGFRYQDPWEANDDPAWQEHAQATEREIATAVADVRCKQETNLVGIWMAVEAAYQQRLIERHAEALADVKRLIETRARNAARVLAGEQVDNDQYGHE